MAPIITTLNLYVWRQLPASKWFSMGNIRPTYIKRVAIELVKRYPDRFNEDFQHNMTAVEEMTDIQNNKLRNRIAGYVTRFRKYYEA